MIFSKLRLFTGLMISSVATLGYNYYTSDITLYDIQNAIHQFQKLSERDKNAHALSKEIYGPPIPFELLHEYEMREIFEFFHHDQKPIPKNIQETLTHRYNEARNIARPTFKRDSPS